MEVTKRPKRKKDNFIPYTKKFAISVDFFTSVLFSTVLLIHSCSGQATAPSLIGIRPLNSDAVIKEGSVHLFSETATKFAVLGSGFERFNSNTSSERPPSLDKQVAIKVTKAKLLRGSSCGAVEQSEAFILSVKSNEVAHGTMTLDEFDKEPRFLCLGFTERDSQSGDVRWIYEHQGEDSLVTIFVDEKIVEKELIPLWLQIIILVVLLTLSGLFSGLNLGLMALDRTELKIVENYGTPTERNYAKVIRPIRNRGNFLLCTLLLGNVLVNASLTIILDNISTGLIAVIGSTLGIVIFGEIVPQAICSRHGLAIGAKTIWLTKLFMILTFPLSFPVSKLLDLILGEELGNVYGREKLMGLIQFTKERTDLQKDEVEILLGGLQLKSKTVDDIMTPLEDVYMVEYDTILNFETISNIMQRGYTRIPVYENERSNIVALLNIKDLAFVDPDDNIPLKSICKFYKHPVTTVFHDTTLDCMLDQFKKGKSHMAFVVRVNEEGDGDPFYECVGLVTLEDVIEEIIQSEIIDETDVITDNVNKHPRKERQDYSTIMTGDSQLPTNVLPMQLAFAAFQYLATIVEPFRDGLVSDAVLRRMLRERNIVQKYRLRDADHVKTEPRLLYERGKPADYFIMILEGQVKVTIGQESIVFESGPFSCYGVQALQMLMVSRWMIEGTQPLRILGNSIF